MIDKTIQRVYRYMLTKDVKNLVSLLIYPEGVEFADAYFSGPLRQECIDCLNDFPVLKRHYEQQVNYVNKHVNKICKRTKGCFSRV